MEMLLGYLNKVGIAEVVAICSMLAAWVAAREAIRSRRLMARMQQQSELAIDIYSANHYVARSPKDAVHRFYVFHLLITNSSTVNNSIKAMELSLAFSQDKGPRPNIVCPHNIDSARCLGGLDSQQIFPCSAVHWCRRHHFGHRRVCGCYESEFTAGELNRAP